MYVDPAKIEEFIRKKKELNDLKPTSDFTEGYHRALVEILQEFYGED